MIYLVNMLVVTAEEVPLCFSVTGVLFIAEVLMFKVVQWKHAEEVARSG